MRPNPQLTGECPLCGWTQEEYERTELVGCALCYSSLNVNAPTKGATT